jgi:hypothetical protein
MMDDDRDKEISGEPAPTEEEERAARALASATQRLLTGDPLEGPVDDLVATAQMIRTSLVEEQHLPAARRDSLIDEALQRSRARRAPGRMRRLAPYLALAASLVLVLTSVVLQTRPDGPPRPGRSRAAQQLSRPSNDLMGQPFKDRAGASRRLDLVFADRLSGYRQVRLLAVRTPEMRGTP